MALTNLYDLPSESDNDLHSRVACTNESNPIDYRIAGCVGQPLPYVQCRLVCEDSGTAINSMNTPGELRVKGPTVFKEYRNLKQITAAAFDSEGWFKTGDIAELVKVQVTACLMFCAHFSRLFWLSRPFFHSFFIFSSILR